MFLPVHINENGYMFNSANGRMVHKETRKMGDWDGSCHQRARAIKAASNWGDLYDCVGVLELTEAGGGNRILTLNNNDLWKHRLKRWECCYGEWELL